MGGLTPPFACRRRESRARSVTVAITTSFAAIVCIQTLPAYSDERAGNHTLQTSIGIGSIDFDYREFNDGKRLNREHGNLFGLTASAKIIRRKHFFAADIAWFANAVDYHGETQNGVQLKLDYQLRLATSWRINIEGVYTAWTIGRSREATLRRNGAAIGKLLEPASETRSAGLTVNATYAF